MLVKEGYGVFFLKAVSINKLILLDNNSVSILYTLNKLVNT